ncbi:MAG: SRPBCC domain-containing protein [Leptospiraceae bacterium]|nr:SRPBCC domain-containing protein [Leptospiraceae bacterium]
MELYTQIEINSSREKIWNVFTDTSKYLEWNPFIKYIFGELKLNNTIYEIGYTEENIYLPYKMKVKTFEPFHQIIFESDLDFFSRLIFFDHHRYLLEEIGSKKFRFSHTAFFSGIIAELKKDHILTNIKRVHDEMNLALKKRVEIA